MPTAHARTLRLYALTGATDSGTLLPPKCHHCGEPGCERDHRLDRCWDCRHERRDHDPEYGCDGVVPGPGPFTRPRPCGCRTFGEEEE